MCDYSLEQVASRPAAKGDRLVTAGFANTITRGFAGPDDANTAVCLLPGTEIVFDELPRIDRFLFFTRKVSTSKVARFRQVNLHEARCHHDVLEFADGRIVPLTRLATGQAATVLQLPRGGFDEHIEHDPQTPAPADAAA